MNTIELLLGPNWRTTLSGWAFNIGAIIVALSLLPKETWQDPKITIPTVLGVLAKFIQDWHTKDKQVTGNGSVNDPFKVNDGDGSNRPLPPLTSILLAIGIGTLICGCAWVKTETQTIATWSASSAGKNTLSAIENVVWGVATDVLLNLGQQYIDNGQIDGVQVGIAAVQGASYQLRSLEGTPQASDPAAITDALAQGSANHPAVVQSVAPAVVKSVVSAIQNGAPPSAAIESAAVGLDKSVAAVTSTP